MKKKKKRTTIGVGRKDFICEDMLASDQSELTLAYIPLEQKSADDFQ